MCWFYRSFGDVKQTSLLVAKQQAGASKAALGQRRCRWPCRWHRSVITAIAFVARMQGNDGVAVWRLAFGQQGCAKSRLVKDVVARQSAHLVSLKQPSRQ